MHNAHNASMAGRLKARITLLGIRQNRMAADLGMGVTRLNRILNAWVRATTEELEQMRGYIRQHERTWSRSGRDARR